MFTILGADGKSYGPVAAEKIKEWMAAGRANLQTKAKREGDMEWQALGAFPEFGAVPPPAGGPPPMPASQPAPQPALVTAAPAVADVEVMELANRWARLGAAILDSLIAGACALPGLALMLATGVFANRHQPNPALLFGGIGVMILGVLILLGVQIYLLSTQGQTIGKKLVGVRIVNFDDETNPGFVKAFLLRVFVNGLIGAVPFAGAAYSLVDICFIFRDDQRCIHDLIAGTKVVKA